MRGTTQVEPVAAIAQRVLPSNSFVGRIADALTLLGTLLSPLFGLALGGRLGLPYADIVLGLAALARGTHLVLGGLQISALRRHSYLIGLLCAFAAAGVVSGFANGGNPLPWDFLRLVIASLGSVLLVATFGDGNTSRRALLQAFGLGCTILAVSSLYGPTGAGRSIGYSIHPNALGHSCMMGCAAAAWLRDSARSQVERRLWGIAVLLGVVGLIRSGSRGGILGLGLALLIYLVFRGSVRLALGVVAAAWLVGLTVASGIVSVPDSNPLKRLVSETEDTGSNQARLELLDEDWERITKDPVWGEGYQGVVSVHVAYLQGWVGGGAIDGLLLMLLGITALLLPWLVDRKDLALACGATSIAVAWTFTNLLTVRDQWLFLAIAFGAAQSIRVLGPDRQMPATTSS